MAKIAKILATYEGSKGDVYEIREGDDSVTYCTCWAWRTSKVPKTCKHLKDFFSRAVPVGTKVYYGHRLDEDISTDPLEQVISAEAERLTQGHR